MRWDGERDQGDSEKAREGMWGLGNYGNELTGKELAKGGKVQALTDLVNKLDNELAKVKTQLENTSGTLADDSKHVEEAKKAIKEVSLLDLYDAHHTDTRSSRNRSRQNVHPARPLPLRSLK
jgi:capsule polysaccharide export protein KpsE/RkpR